MSNIPKHKMSDKYHGEVAFVKRFSANIRHTGIDYDHRDDHYLFLFIERGKVRLSLDFEEYDVEGPAVLFVLPEQVHRVVEQGRDAEGWLLLADRMFVAEECREIFENVSPVNRKLEPNRDKVSDLRHCFSMLDKRANVEKQSIGQSIIHSLLSTCIGMIAEAYQSGLPVSVNKRYAVITHRFRELLSANYKTMKSPSQYASALSISPVYLNEAVKNTTGMTVTGCIQNEVATQAKRLLFYTDMNVREIAAELGYEDWAYFTRLFTKAASVTPTQFRAKYLK